MKIRSGLTITMTLTLALGSLAVLRPAAGFAQDSKAPEDKGAQAEATKVPDAKPAQAEASAASTAQTKPEQGAAETTPAITSGPAALEMSPVPQNQTPPPAATGNGVGLYTINSTAEVGWRFKGTDGNATKFRSDLNYDRGARLMSSEFLARSNNGGGTFFDNFLFSSFGWGGDPSQYMHIEVDKTKWYRFDGSYRRLAYFNNLQNLALNQHTADTTYEVGDFDLTLLPQNEKLKIYLGYSLDNLKGNTLATYDYSHNEFPILAPTNSHANNYRFGFDSRLWIFDLSFLQGFRYFKDDTQYLVSGPEKGNSPGTTQLATFHRDFPTRGTDPFTRFSLHTLVNKKLDFTGRIIYASARTDYSFFETVTGTDFLGNKVILDQTAIGGNAKRPNALGDFGVSYFATDKFTISDTFRVNSFRINGGDNFVEQILNSKNNIPAPPVITDTLSFQLLSYRVLLNTIEGDYKFHPRFSAHVGYRHTDRRVVLANYNVPPGGNLASPPDTNATDSVFGGFRARPFNPWTIYFDFEHGASDNVFTRISNYDYNNFRVRSLIKPTKTLLINTSLVTKNNDNPTLAPVGNAQVPFGVTVRSRFFSASVDWTPNQKFSLSTGYTYSHVDSDAAVILFLNFNQTQGTSLYFLRDNFAFATTRVQLHPRATLFAGFRLNKDTGQGDRTPSGPSVLISSYPMHLITPEARLSINLRRWLDWNAGWQYFDYNDQFFPAQNYQAHIGYISLTVRFNRE
jgi:hypothetical protein